METGGEADPLNAVGDQGQSQGPYQIMEDYYNDAVQHDPSLRDGGKSMTLPSVMVTRAIRMLVGQGVWSTHAE